MKKRTENNKKQTRGRTFWTPGAVVGTAHTHGGLRAAAALPAGVLSAVEVRLDVLSPNATELAAIKHPLILTPRGHSEGGALEWTAVERTEKTLPLLEFAGAVDVELSAAAKMSRLCGECHQRKVPLIFSFHDFAKTPGRKKLHALHAKALDEGASVFKVAALLHDAADLAELLIFLHEARSRKTVPVAVMGMGALGRASRIMLGTAGSALNYGWLHKPQVPGQWPARKLARLLAECAA